MSPPKLCEKENLVWLTKVVPADFISYKASSSRNSSYKPDYSVLDDKSTKSHSNSWQPQNVVPDNKPTKIQNIKSWQPKYTDTEQW